MLTKVLSAEKLDVCQRRIRMASHPMPELRGSLLGNMSLRMEPNEKCREPAHRRTGPDRYRPIGRQECKYAEKSYKYKYDLGHSF